MGAMVPPFVILRSIFAPREHLGMTFWQLGGPWGAILTPRDHLGGPWEQQDGLEVANNLGVILGLIYGRFWKPKCLQTRFFVRTSLQLICLSISDSNFRRVGLPNRCFRRERIAKIGFS